MYKRGNSDLNFAVAMKVSIINQSTHNLTLGLVFRILQKFIVLEGSHIIFLITKTSSRSLGALASHKAGF